MSMKPLQLVALIVLLIFLFSGCIKRQGSAEEIPSDEFGQQPGGELPTPEDTIEIIVPQRQDGSVPVTARVGKFKLLEGSVLSNLHGLNEFAGTSLSIKVDQIFFQNFPLGPVARLQLLDDSGTVIRTALVRQGNNVTERLSGSGQGTLFLEQITVAEISYTDTPRDYIELEIG